jgi:hypothetical protein
MQTAPAHQLVRRASQSKSRDQPPTVTTEQADPGPRLNFIRSRNATRTGTVPTEGCAYTCVWVKNPRSVTEFYGGIVFFPV